MDAVMPNAQSSVQFTGMNSGWNINSYAGACGPLDFPEPDLNMPLGDANSNLSFDDAMSAFTNQEPTYQKPYSPANTIEPMNMWPPVPNRACETPSTSSKHDSAYSSAETPKSTGSGGLEGSGMMPYPSLAMPPTTAATDSFGMAAYSSPAMSPATTAAGGIGTMPYPTSVSPKSLQPSSPNLQLSAPTPAIQPESDSTCRARYAANQRHQKARKLRQEARESSSDTNSSTASSHNNNAQTLTKAEEKKRNLREKNKVAAAKCRQRQRKQAETIRTKGSRLSETNAQLKSYVQELRGELNALRSLALGHGECDERLAQYNQVQAERVMREYYSACGGLAGSMVNGNGNGREQQQQQLKGEPTQ